MAVAKAVYLGCTLPLLGIDQERIETFVQQPKRARSKQSEHTVTTETLTAKKDPTTSEEQRPKEVEQSQKNGDRFGGVDMMTFGADDLNNVVNDLQQGIDIGHSLETNHQQPVDDKSKPRPKYDPEKESQEYLESRIRNGDTLRRSYAGTTGAEADRPPH